MRTGFFGSFLCPETQFWNRLCLLENYGLTIVHMCWKMWDGNSLHLLEKYVVYAVFPRLRKKIQNCWMLVCENRFFWCFPVSRNKVLEQVMLAIKLLTNHSSYVLENVG